MTQLEQQENQVIRELVLPEAPPPPVYVPQPEGPAYSAPAFVPEPAPDTADRAPADPAQADTRPQPGNQSGNQSGNQPRQAPTKITYALTLNRSPVVGNRLRLQGVYPETRLGFTRPQGWTVESAKAIIRYQHSPSLLADRSHLTVRVNDTSVGSVPLDRPDSQIGQATFNIPANLIQDSNELSMLAEQQTSDTCSNPTDPTLWTEILPDSKLVFEFIPKATTLNFSQYPYPFLDEFGLEPNQLAYLRPQSLSADWLTAVSRFQASAGRLSDRQILDTRLVTNVDQISATEGLVVIGTPADQPILSRLAMGYSVQNGQLLDGSRQPLPNDVGLLAVATTRNQENRDIPVLVATGNSAEGVLKAVQYLVQAPDRQLATGQAVTVSNVAQVPTPEPRSWSGYLPTQNEFQLRELTTLDGQPYSDITVHGTNAPIIEVGFRALPDDRLLQGSTMTLHYSHSPQLNSNNSAVEVMIDGVTIGSKRLTGNGQDNTFNVNLPPHLIQPDSTLGVHFILQPEQPGICGLTADQQLWGTLHADTRFNLNRENVVQVPNLELLKAGFPLASPQDLSTTAIVLPNNPTDTDVETLLSFSERMGRVSRSDSVKLTAYLANAVPTEVRDQQNLVAIGARERFPYPEVFEASSSGLSLATGFFRQWEQSQAQTLPDREGVIKAIPSPWSRDRVLLALTGQTDEGLREVQDLFNRDPLFSQLRGDTVLISRNQATPSPYDASGYNLEFLQQTQPRQIRNTTLLRRIVLFLQDNWWLLLLGMVLLALLLYSFSQLFMNRVA
ncbi:cellulose biosynthesis cyclic di-GMP-binding regulatory protein BcsB [Thermocoleostomius sinensis]|uniref:Cellulose biosynthesis cyclic di-GMP-binding regulatory protein BcsB n=1 Tax=Thermocoleostomius sinensis A174 TaxID=2016057 RepID=A0A9E9CBA6_9CYAN|nr:cellulose biosynthesis cyclic di-GMP-binding regulatory protein BcsB [Thermocoleostomius sinensis]WAL62057.1 cellulose biosynthesis cyclic di-GMP-binding regulatory protein BcsB [Thermocoleostomius sinensis A174]